MLITPYLHPTATRMRSRESENENSPTTSARTASQRIITAETHSLFHACPCRCRASERAAGKALH